MLGIWFDTVKWIWYVSEEKVLRYCNDLNDMLGMETVTQRYCSQYGMYASMAIVRG